MKDEILALEDGRICIGDREFPSIISPRFGKVVAPKTLPDLWHLLTSVTEGESRIVGWRGQSDLAWAIDSSAVRRVKTYGPPPSRLLPAEIRRAADSDNPIDPGDPAALEYFVQQYEGYLLNEARLAGHDFHNGRSLGDLELLAVLQHYGAATRLLDFSRNVAVALWFSCSDHPDSYGLLAAVDARKTRQLTSVADSARPIRETVLVQNYSWTFSWQPQHLFERMRIQQSFFLFSKAESHEWGSLALPGPGQKESGLFLAAISPELKSEVARSWQQRLSGLSGLSLFPDLEGFSRFQSASAPYLSIY